MSGQPMITDVGDNVERAAQAICAVLKEAIKVRGQASLMVSGGSSPKPVYSSLSKADLDWSRVTISLVDERWVDSGQTGSNEDFIRENLLQNEASDATFFGLKTTHETVAEGLSEAESRFANIAQPFDVCVMGMGGDMHTASWFPNSVGLEEALSPENQNILCAIDATGCPVAGDHPDRISLTLPAVISAHAVILFIPGAEKRAVFDSAFDKELYDAPVKALQQAGAKLHIFASPSS